MAGYAAWNVRICPVKIRSKQQVVTCMFSNVYATEIAGPPWPKILTVTPTPTVKPTQTPISTPELMPTQKPTPTPVPDTAEKDASDPADQGTLSRPDHPDTISADKLVFIGDSRTEGLR